MMAVAAFLIIGGGVAFATLLPEKNWLSNEWQGMPKWAKYLPWLAIVAGLVMMWAAM